MHNKNYSNDYLYNYIMCSILYKKLFHLLFIKLYSI